MSSVTEITCVLMMSRASLPFLVMTSISETIPTTMPSAPITGAPVMRLELSVWATSSTGVSSRKVITFRVITSLTGIMGRGAV